MSQAFDGTTNGQFPLEGGVLGDVITSADGLAAYGVIVRRGPVGVPDEQDAEDADEHLGNLHGGAREMHNAAPVLFPVQRTQREDK